MKIVQPPTIHVVKTVSNIPGAKIATNKNDDKTNENNPTIKKGYEAERAKIIANKKNRK